ncbi:hypothetical protein ACVXHB_23265 [Escherichia coli]
MYFSPDAATQRVLFLWRNADTVVIGRAQNPWKHGTPGGWKKITSAWRGAVAVAARCSDDLGNTCFTFMAGKPEYDKTISTSIGLMR